MEEVKPNSVMGIRGIAENQESNMKAFNSSKRKKKIGASVVFRVCSPAETSLSGKAPGIIHLSCQASSLLSNT